MDRVAREQPAESSHVLRRGRLACAERGKLRGTVVKYLFHIGYIWLNLELRTSCE